MGRQAAISIEVTDAAKLQKALRVLAEEDAPYLREALADAGRDLTHAVSARAPGSMGAKTQFAGVKGKAHGLRATVLVKHPGAKSMEFGRKNWTRQGRKVRHTPGQAARPFVGIVRGGQAIGAVEAKVKERIADAVSREWDRLG